MNLESNLSNILTVNVYKEVINMFKKLNNHVHYNGCTVTEKSKETAGFPYAKNFIHLNDQNKIEFEKVDSLKDSSWICINGIITTDKISLMQMLDALFEYSQMEGYDTIKIEGNWLKDADILNMLIAYGFSHEIDSGLHHLIFKISSNSMNTNNYALYCIRLLYLNKKGVGTVLHEIFDTKSSITEAGANKWDLLPLVYFAYNKSFSYNTKPTGKEPELETFCKQLNYICKKLEPLTKEKTKKITESEYEHAKLLLREAKNDPPQMRFITYYAFVMEHWNILRDWPETYPMLCSLVSMEDDRNDSPEIKNELANLIFETYVKI